MARAGWKKYKQKKVKGVNGKKGYVFRKKIYADSNGQGALFIPKRFARRMATIVILLDDENGVSEEVNEENKDIEEVDPFK